MTTALITHPDFLQHKTPAGHPERADRLRAIWAALDFPAFADLVRVEAIEASRDQLLRAHPGAYVDHILGAGPGMLDPDTHMSSGSARAAKLAAGANVQAVDLVLSGQVTNAFCAVRPPGHHAEAQHAMGFCLFGNAVVGTRHALDYHGLSRVAIIDFDVHHGNGTQALAWDDARIAYASTHQMPLYPGTGSANERGAHGQILNCPLGPGTDGALLQAVFERQIAPFMTDHRPEMIVISAGFDAHVRDPLAGLNWRTEDFAWVTEAICDLADTLCDGRVVSTLEGGYDLEGLAASAAAHVMVLMERAR